MADPSSLNDSESPGHDLASGRYTMAEAARVKGVSYHTVSRAVRSGRLPAQRLGRMALIDASDLRAWQPMRERAPRKYRRDMDEREVGPAIVESPDADNRMNQLATAVMALHEGAAKRTIDSFGDWLASLTSSLLVMRQVIIWRRDDASGKFVPFGSAGVADRDLSPMLSDITGQVLTSVVERAEVMKLGPDTLECDATRARLPFDRDESILAIPCRVGARSVGLILGGRGEDGPPLGADESLIAKQFGSQAAVAIEHVELRCAAARQREAVPALYDELPLQVMAIDRTGQVVYLSREMARQWGDAVVNKYVGRHYAHFVGMFRRERLDGSVVRIEDHPFTRALRGEQVIDEPHLVPGFFGQPKIFSLSARPLRDQHGNISGAVLVSRETTSALNSSSEDIAQLRSISEARRKVDVLGTLSTDIGHPDAADDVYHLVAERVCNATGADAAVVFTPTGDGRMLVRAGHQMPAGVLPPGQVLHRLQVMGSTMAMAQRDLFMTTREDAGPTGRQFLSACDTDGAVIIPLLDADEAKGVVVALFADVDELRRVDREFARAVGRQCGHAIHLRDAMSELEASRRRLLTVIDQLPQAVIILDAPEGNVVVVNQEAVRLWGSEIARTGARGVDFTMLDDEGRPIRSARRHPFLRPLHTRERSLGLPLMTLDASGAVVDVLVNVAPISGASGTPRGVAVVVQRREHFRPIERAKDEFISVVAHELRNPLTSLRGNLQLLERHLGRLDDPAVERELSRVASVIEQVDRVGDLVNRMLDVSRADLGKLTIHPAPCDAAELVHGTVAEIRGQASGRTITVDAPGSVPVVWDALRIRQILTNLLTNALRYAPEGSIEVDLVINDAQDRVSMSVRDHGPGVPNRLKRRLFRLYHRFEDGEETADGLADGSHGLGIGLYISGRLARAHGGELHVEDARGGGAEFVLTLPRRVASEG